MIYYHKNPSIQTVIDVLKIQYRDEKRMKLKMRVYDLKATMLPSYESYTVNPKFLYNFTTIKPEKVPDNEDLLKLDEEKENYILS